MLDNPDAQNNCTPCSLIFAPSCEWRVMEQVFELAHPAIFIGSQLEHYLDHTHFCVVEEWSRQEAEKKEKLKFERVYKPFFQNRLSLDVATEPNGRTERVYWKSEQMEENIEGKGSNM